MARPLTSTETDPAALAEQTVEEAALDEMLNTQGFAEFLAKHPEGSMKHEAGDESLTRAFEVFRVKEEVKEGLKEMYAGEMAREMGMDISREDLSSLDSHLESQAIENPDAILEFRDKLARFKSMPDEIEGLEAEVGKLSHADGWKAQLASLEAKHANIQTLKENMFSLGGALSLLADMPRAMETYKAAKALKGEGVPLHIGNLNVSQMETKERIKHIEDAVKGRGVEGLKGLLERDYAALRADILKGVSSTAEVASLIKEKAAEELKALIAGNDIDGAQDRFEKLREIQESSGDKAIDLGIDASATQDKIDEMIERASLEQMFDSIRSMRLGRDSLSEMERSLGFFLEKDKLGSKKGLAARKLIGKTLREAEKRLGDSVEAKAKRILIARIKTKFKL